MKFPYRPYEAAVSTPARPSIFYRPVIPVDVFGPSGKTTIFGLLDTGADITVLPDALLDQIGISKSTMAHGHVRGVGGPLVAVRYAEVELQVRQGRSTHRWLAPVAFLHADTVAILGHAGFLEHYTAAFDGKRKEVTLTLHR